MNRPMTVHSLRSKPHKDLDLLPRVCTFRNPVDTLLLVYPAYHPFEPCHTLYVTPPIDLLPVLLLDRLVPH